MTKYKADRNTYYSACRHAQVTTWKKMLTDAKGKDIWTVFRYTQPRKSQLSPPLTKDGAVCTTWLDKVALLRRSLFPDPPPAVLATVTAAPEIPWVTFTPNEISKAIATSAPNKAPGPDGLSFLCIQSAYNAIPDFFYSLYATLGTVGYQPACWREANTVVIPKPNKPDYTNPKAYRPIALLNCLGKVLEKLMASRLSHMAETMGLLHPDQMGGRPRRSAIDAALALTHETETALLRNQVASMLLMDVRGAFDNVNSLRLCNTMTEWGVPKVVIRYVTSFLSNRYTCLTFDGQREPQSPVQTGIPQGSPISPILFLFYIRPLFDELNKHHPDAWVPSYMDDVCIHVVGKSREANARTLEKIAATAFRWADNNAVAFDDSKTELLHFHRARKDDVSPSILVTLPNGTTVNPGTPNIGRDVVRWIGIWFDRKLTFKQHVITKAAASHRALNALMRLSNTECGLSPPAVRQLYLACVVESDVDGRECCFIA